MASRNERKIYGAHRYYHVYNRGVNKRTIFKDEADYAVFLNLLKRYLDSVVHKDEKGREYLQLHEELKLLAFCLMPNHFHLFIYQCESNTAITQLMRAVSVTYVGYFNKKYGRIGPLFQGIFKASDIDREDYFIHISRYIHLNPRNYNDWEFSSLPYYLGRQSSGWVQPQQVLDAFGADSYLDFLADYSGHRQMMDEIKPYLASY